MMKNLKEEIKTVVDIYKSGNLIKAEPICEKLIVENPKVAFLYNLSGLILFGQRKFDDAIKRYEEGLKVDPNFGMIYNNLGLLFFERKSYGYIKKAEEDPEIHSKLSAEFVDTFWSEPDADLREAAKGLF